MTQMPSIILSVIALVTNTVVAIFLFRLRTAQDKTNKGEDERNRQVAVATADLKAAIGQIHELTAKLVDERFRALSHDMANHVNGFKLTLDDLNQKLHDGAETYESLTQRDQTIEMAVAGKFEQLKQFLFDNMAGKKDLERHQQTVDNRFEKLGERVETLGKGLAVAEHVMRTGRGISGK